MPTNDADLDAIAARFAQMQALYELSDCSPAVVAMSLAAVYLADTPKLLHAARVLRRRLAEAEQRILELERDQVVRVGPDGPSG